MLVELTIKNIALIESLCVEFTQGFNVLTGETGAGKSIIVDCINLVLGGRADRDMIRTGAEKGMVQALFDISGNEHANDFIRSLDIESDEGIITVRRELNREGRNICRICDVVIPLNTLKQLTSSLMDIHGQHEHQALLNPSRHIDFLDSFAGASYKHALENVRRLYEIRSSIASELKKRTNDVAEKERLTDVLSFQLHEINSAKLKAGEEQKLEHKMAILENTEKIRSGIEQAYTFVYQGDSQTISVQEALHHAAESMERISGLNEQYSRLAERIRELYYSAQDVAYELQSLLDNLESDPKMLEKVAARLDLIGKLERKYGSTVEEVIAFGHEVQDRLEMLNRSEENITELKKRYKEADINLRDACNTLSALRRSCAEKLEKQISTQLKDLGMSKTRFVVRLEPEPKPTLSGMDRIEFMISPNPGEPLRPLADIASGGELSRVMLALKAISADSEGVDAMVFDEIDTGVSGRMAQVVGEKMCLIAKKRQVLSITHLPQIAALGDTHFLVEKSVRKDRTVTHLRLLDNDGRVEEISRLVSGTASDTSSLSHAHHMLQEAVIRKETIRV